MRFLISATITCLALAALYYAILAAYTPNIIVVPVIKFLSATAATASAVTATSAATGLLLIAGALLLAYFAAQGISRLFSPRYLSSPVVEINRPWYAPIESQLAWLLRPDANRHFNHFTRNANGRSDYNPEYTPRREHHPSRNNQGYTTDTRSSNNFSWFQPNQEHRTGHAATRSSQVEHHQSTRNASGFLNFT